MTPPTITFRVLPLAAAASRQIRLAQSGAPGGPLLRRDGERHQCRSCLSLSRPDEACLLFSHSPFPRAQPYAEAGPVFIHQRPCEPYAIRGEFPPDFRELDLVLRAYNEAGEIVGAARRGDRPVESAIADLLRDPGTAYLHARNTEYGCFICRIERA
jgi:hypothetical protein